jgi:hypothetical protein
MINHPRVLVSYCRGILSSRAAIFTDHHSIKQFNGFAFGQDARLDHLVILLDGQGNDLCTLVEQLGERHTNVLEIAERMGHLVFQTGSACDSRCDSNHRVIVIFCWV